MLYDGIRTYAILVTLALLVAAVSIGNPAFLSWANLMNILSQWAPAGIIAAGMTYVVLVGGFDLSIASAFSLCAVVAAVVGQYLDPSVAFMAAIGAGILVGAVNGFFIARVGINPFITTVGVGFMLTGLALLLTDNAAFMVANPAFSSLGTGRLFGVPYSGILLIATLLLLQIVLWRTVYGELIYSVGGNYEASWLSGIRVNLVVASTYMLVGACYGIAGSITASQLSSAQANMDPSIVFDVLTIVVVGGTSLAGGSGAVWRTAVGIAIIATITNGFVLLDISPYYQSIIKGAIIVMALSVDALFRKLASQ
ncbi:Inner-membrane translocator [Aminobacter aminovorans]|uniref:Inner-membrane translocator n=1 Tax=Aminobacter aminovorans TaxID=83263 RepID=A0AAC8YRC6_AMIAI|nr:Inner-membrane translocator [Aminobacter aminovorans]